MPAARASTRSKKIISPLQSQGRGKAQALQKGFMHGGKEPMLDSAKRNALVKPRAQSVLWMQICGYLRGTNMPWLAFPIDLLPICPAKFLSDVVPFPPAFLHSPLIPRESHFPSSPFKLGC